MDKRLKKLISKYWNEHKEIVQKQFKNEDETNLIPSNSVPIMWHGDLDRYVNSNYKVVTVSINPHFRAFDPIKGHFDMEVLKTLYPKQTLADQDIKILSNQYNTYFDQIHYQSENDRLFKRYEEILNRVNTSYFKHQNLTNQALHIDLLSPLATNPVWSNIPKDIKNELLKNGPTLCMEFIKYLNPDLIISSMSKEVLKNALQLDDTWKQTLFEKPNVTRNKISGILFERSRKKVLYGQQTRYGKVYFGRFSDEEFEDMLEIVSKKCKPQPTKEDLLQIIDILLPIKTELQTFNQHYINGDFQPEMIEETNVFYYKDSTLYQTLGVKKFAETLHQKLLQLPNCNYHINRYFEIEEKHGISLPYIMDEDWTNEDIYYYLIHMIEDETDDFLVEQAILNGDFLEILSALKLRMKGEQYGL